MFLLHRMAYCTQNILKFFIRVGSAAHHEAVWTYFESIGLAGLDGFAESRYECRTGTETMYKTYITALKYPIAFTVVVHLEMG